MQYTRRGRWYTPRGVASWLVGAITNPMFGILVVPESTQRLVVFGWLAAHVADNGVLSTGLLFDCVFDA